MIKKAITLVLSLFVCMLSIVAQHTPCGYDIILNKISKHKEYSEDVRSVFDNAVNDKNTNRFDETFVIPITFHVVWKDTTENIDDSLILQQVEVLNENYRRLNSNANEVRAEFMDIVGDANIEFELTEIIRVHTDTIFDVDLFGGGLIDYVKHTADGGSDAIDVETNLNVWVCDIKKFTVFGQEGKLLGYSYPPAGLSHWPPDFFAPSPELDGVVMDFRAIGRNNPHTIEIPDLPDPLDTEGRTLVHEVVHYLGLRHIWGDAQFNGCSVDDGVDDTPNCDAASNFNCSHTKNSCEQNKEGDLPDMVENFMDYSTEACMNSFTNGQIAIMRSVLRNVRCKLVGNCEHVSSSDILQNDIQLFPNPASDNISIQGDFGYEKPISVTIYNALGIVVQDKTELVGSTINVSDFSKGMYFFEIGMGEQNIIKKVVLK